MITITLSPVQSGPQPSNSIPTDLSLVDSLLSDFLPTPLPTAPLPTGGLVLQLDGDTGVKTNAGVVRGWTDRSGAGNHLSSVGNPTLHAGAFNGHDIIQLDGSDRLLRRLKLNRLTNGNQNRSMFLVAKYEGIRFDSVAHKAAFDGDRTAYSGVARTGAGWLIQEIIQDATTVRHYEEGQLVDTRHTDKTAQETSTDKAGTSQSSIGQSNINRGEGLVIGAELEGNPHVSMGLAALLIYDYALSDTERQQVEAYLQSKYF